MPRVPRIDPFQRTPLAPLPTPRVRGAPPGGLGGRERLEAIQEAGALIGERGKIIRNELDRAHQLKVREEDTFLRAEADRLRIRMADEFKGKNAVENDLIGIANERWNAILEGRRRGEEQQNLPNRTQEAIGFLADNYGQRLNTFAVGHTAQEKAVYENEAFRSHLKQVLQSAGLNRDPAFITESVLSGLVSINEFARTTGKSDEWIKANETAWQSSVIRHVTEAMLQDGEDREAKRFFDLNKEKLVPDDRKALQPRIEESSFLGEALRRSDEFMADKDITLSAGLAEIGKITDARLRKETERAFKSAFRDRQVAEQLEEEQRLDKLTKELFLLGGDLQAIRRTSADFELLSAESQNALRRYSAILGRGMEPQTNWGVYHRLRTMDPEELIEVNLMRHRADLGDTEFKQMINLQTQLRGKDREAGTSKIRSFRSEASRVDSMLRQFGFDPTTKSDRERSRIENFRQFIDRRSQDAQRELKRRLTPKEFDDIVRDALSTKVVIDRSWIVGDIERPIGMVLPEEQGAQGKFERERAFVPLADIPPAKVDVFKKILESEGRTVTDDKIERLYAADLLDDEILFNRILQEAP